jgi:tRNA(adenine34) deaminase
MQQDAASDPQWMRLAIEQAQAAETAGEVPVGAVVVCQGTVIATGRNACVAGRDPTAHAEIVALRSAAQHLGNYRLQDCELFVTLEPCSMCAGAMLQARLKRVVFGAPDPKTGAAGSVINLFALAPLNHQTGVLGGVLQEACAALLQEFFRRQRARNQLNKAEPGRALRDDALRTPESRFRHWPELSAYSCHVSDLPSLGGLRLHYLDSGPASATHALVYLHGPDDWCCVWRQQFNQAAQQGVRVICPDLIGFGKSDKPKKTSFHRLEWHAQVMLEWLSWLNLSDIMLISPASMEALTQRIRAGAGGQRVRTRYSQAQAVDLAMSSAPFPDAGHRAALRAFAAINKPV